MKPKKKKSKLRSYKQETPDSCAVACLRSVLYTYGHEEDEAILRELCHTTSSGTLSDDLVKGARKLGFEAEKEFSYLQVLIKHLKINYFPILYINLYFIDGIDCVHAVIATEIKDRAINIFDPLEGERSISLSVFEKAWQLLNNLAIIIKPKK